MTTTVTESDLELPDGRTLHVYDTGPAGGLPVVWHHGTPNLGAPPKPLFPAAERFGIRWVSYDRPGYGTSTPVPGRDLASAAADTAAVVDALGIERFALMGHSGGGPHALACAALLAGRVSAAVDIAGLAPYGLPGLDWFAGMHPAAASGLRAALDGRAAAEKHEAQAELDPETFTPADHEALGGTWSWFGEVVEPAMACGPAPVIDDYLAYVGPPGFGLAGIAAPLLLLHGGQDRVDPAAHAEWLAEHIPSAELRLVPEAGHISVLDSAAAALEWLRERAAA